MYIYWLYMLEINRAGTVRMKKAVMKRRRRIWEAGACASSRWAARWTWVWTWSLAPQTTGRQLRRLSAWGSVRRWCWPGRTIDAVRNTCVCVCVRHMHVWAAPACIASGAAILVEAGECSRRLAPLDAIYAYGICIVHTPTMHAWAYII